MAVKEANRSDYSPYIIHFTKDANRRSASENLLKILREKKIDATFSNFWIEPEDEEIKAICFTEVPFPQIKDFVAYKKTCAKQYRFSEYGIAFKKDFIRRKKGNPCLYLNKGESHRVESMQGTHAEYLLGFINTNSERFNFDWEREWRVLSDLSFDYKDIAFVVVKRTQEIKDFCRENKILYLFYDQKPDEILEHFSDVVRGINTTN